MRRNLKVLKLKEGEHMHRCTCGHIWKHRENSCTHDEDHTCRCCGNEIELIYQIGDEQYARPEPD